MLVRQALKTFRLSSLRQFSSGQKLIDVAVNDKTGIAIVTLQRAPVNSLNLELLKALSSTLDELESNRSKGMILTSASSTVFSAGLDILEMYKPNIDRAREFWQTLQDTWLSLYGSSYPTVAAINGHAPAGGCLLAMCCEYRVMQKNFTIGLNETRLGIAAPKWFVSSMRNTIGRRETELALTLGKLFTTDEALKIGLIDEVAEDKAEVLAKAEAFLSQFAKIPPMARAFTKNVLRGDDIQALAQSRDEDLESFLQMVSMPIAQKSLEKYLEGLKKKK